MADKAVTHKLPKIGQPNTKTCWVAAYQMVYAWKNVTLSDANAAAEARKRLDKAGLDTKHELYPPDFEKAAIAVGIWPMATKSMRDYDQFVWCIEKSPIWCVGDFSGGPHAVVVTGFNPSNRMLTVNDPWEIAMQGADAKATMSYDGWAKTIANFRASCQIWYNGR